MLVTWAIQKSSLDYFLISSYGFACFILEFPLSYSPTMYAKWLLFSLCTPFLSKYKINLTFLKSIWGILLKKDKIYYLFNFIRQQNSQFLELASTANSENIMLILYFTIKGVIGFDQVDVFPSFLTWNFLFQQLDCWL